MASVVLSSVSFFLNCLIHVLILFTILTIFFVVYVSNLEKKSFKKEITQLLGSEMDNNLSSMSDQEKYLLYSILSPIDLDSVKQIESKEAKYVEYNNKWLLVLAYSIIIFIIIIVVLLFMILWLACSLRIDILEIITENIVVFIVVGTIEIMFFLMIAAQYIPVKPSLMTKTLVDTLKEKFGT